MATMTLVAPPKTAVTPNPPLISVLTQLQMRTAELLAEAYTFSEIAKELCRSEGAIKNSLKIAYAKLGIADGAKWVILGCMAFNERMRARASEEGHLDEFSGKKLSDIFTESEMAVARYISEGKLSRQIAPKMGWKREQTVRNVLQEMYDKCGFSNRLELALQVHYEKFHAERERSA